MTSKQSYASAVTKQPGGHAGEGSGQGEAPPPYTAPGSSSTPHQTHLPAPNTSLIPHGQAQANGYDTESFHPTAETGWTPPATARIAKSRALRRFWLAMLWAWLIWIAVGMLIGGTISDVEGNPPGRNGHWDKHGKWHDDRWGYASSLLGGKAVADEQVTITQ